jgi:hypothetical protein
LFDTRITNIAFIIRTTASDTFSHLTTHPFI